MDQNEIYSEPEGGDMYVWIWIGLFAVGLVGIITLIIRNIWN